MASILGAESSGPWSVVLENAWWEFQGGGGGHLKIWGVSYNGGFPQQPWVFLLKMIILGCEMGVPPLKETPIWLEGM